MRHLVLALAASALLTLPVAANDTAPAGAKLAVVPNRATTGQADLPATDASDEPELAGCRHHGYRGRGHYYQPKPYYHGPKHWPVYQPKYPYHYSGHGYKYYP